MTRLTGHSVRDPQTRPDVRRDGVPSTVPRALATLVAMLTCADGGCTGPLGAILYLFAPPQPTQNVDAEFSGLKKKTVLVIVYATLNTQYEHPEAALEMTNSVAVELRRNVDGVTVIDARRVVRYQDENPRWDQLPPGRLGRVFNADYVLLVSLQDFQTREAGLGNMLRGRITAEAALYERNEDDLDAGAKPAWRTETPIRVVYPEESPLGLSGNDDFTVRVKAEDIFADLLAKKFYKHKVPVEP